SSRASSASRSADLVDAQSPFAVSGAQRRAAVAWARRSRLLSLMRAERCAEIGATDSARGCAGRLHTRERRLTPSPSARAGNMPACSDGHGATRKPRGFGDKKLTALGPVHARTARLQSADSTHPLEELRAPALTICF